MTANTRAMSERHVVVLVHGIRTFGDWQNRLAALLKSRQPDTDIHVYKYKYFSAFAFLFPPLRRRVVNRFRDYLQDNVDVWRDARVDIVAHSFGTYIVARALALLSDKDPRFHTVILSGSVLKVTFPWNTLIGRERRVRRVINDCARKDIWPLIAQIVVFGMGIAGRYGFVGSTGPDVGLVNRFFPFGHSGFFTGSADYETEDGFMQAMWLPLLTGSAPPEGHALVPPKARWFAGFEYAAEPLKIVFVALICVAIYQGYRSAAGYIDTAGAAANLAEARSRMDSDPVEALLLAVKAENVRRSDETEDLKRHILNRINIQAVQRSAHFRRWSSPGLFGGKGWFRAEKMGDITSDGNLYLYGEKGEARLINPRAFEASKTLESPCRESRDSLTALRFSRSEARILVARHAFIMVYDRKGNLLAKLCRWLTKDQWNYLELLRDDTLLLASANEGQIMFFDFRAENGTNVLHPLTGEFEHRESSGGAVVSLDESRDGRLLLTTHHRGSAFLWRFESGPKPHLTKVKEFGQPPSRRKPVSGYGFSFGDKKDYEFVTSAQMSTVDGTRHFVTTYRSGPATQWIQGTDGTIAELRTLAHGDATVMYAGFSTDGSEVVTVASDLSLQIRDTVTGDMLLAEQGAPDGTATGPNTPE